MASLLALQGSGQREIAIQQQPGAVYYEAGVPQNVGIEIVNRASSNCATVGALQSMERL
jgi:hypothetical protein